MSSLTQYKCVPCRGDSPALNAAEIAVYTPEVPEWALAEKVIMAAKTDLLYTNTNH